MEKLWSNFVDHEFSCEIMDIQSAICEIMDIQSAIVTRGTQQTIYIMCYELQKPDFWTCFR